MARIEDSALHRKAALNRIEDDALRRNTFAQLKHELLKRAMELSILCDCDVQVFVHSARVEGGERATSTQFSSGNPEELLAYIRTHPPAECFSKEDYVRSFSQDKPPPLLPADSPPISCTPAKMPATASGRVAPANPAGEPQATTRRVQNQPGGPLAFVQLGGGCLRAAKAPPRDQPPTSHAGLPLRHSSQCDSSSDGGQGALQGQARMGDVGAKGASMMKMSGSQGNLLVHARVRHGGGGREEHIKTNSGATGEPEHECRRERDAKRQRSEDFGGEGEWADACFVDSDEGHVLQDLSWQ